MESESRDHRRQAEVCAGTHQSDYAFKEEDVPGLAEALAEVAHKWEEIAVALRLSEAVRSECREGSSLVMKLYRVLYQWVIGQHSNAARATRENLKTALASPLVQHPQLARELEDKLKTSLGLQTLTTSWKNSIFRSGVREVIVKRYSQCPEVPRGSWPPVVSKKFVNLALIETCDQPSKSDYSIRGDIDDVLSTKTQVQYDELFQDYQTKESVLILGRPGSGKTTLVHKLVRDWSAGKALQGAELVFLVSLRMLNSKNSCTLSEILQNYINKEYLWQVSDAIEQAEGKQVCFLLDGFDEYSPQNNKESIIFPLLNKSYLVDAMIIVTSRSAAASAAAQIFNDSYKKIEVFGFSKSQIMEYINLFPFSSSCSVNEAHSQKLHYFLSSHPGVLDLCYLPVNCAIICFIYATEPDHLPDTQTQIYALFTRLIIIRQLTSRDALRQLDSLEDLGGQEAEDFKKLCSLAFDMTTQSQQVITKGPASSDEAHSLGLVTTDIIAGLSGYKNSYSFLHLTFQEFLAAYYLSKLNQAEQMSLIEKYGNTVHMQTVWKFYCGLVNFKTGLDRAKKLFSGMDLRMGETGLFIIQCSYEARQATICQLAASKTFMFCDILTDYDMSAIAYTLSVAAAEGSLATPIENLAFYLYDPGDVNLKLFFSKVSSRALKHLKSICCGYVSTSNIEALADKLHLNRRGNTIALKSLTDLSVNGIGDEGVEILAAGLDGNYVLESLDLSYCSISARGVRELMKSEFHLRNLILRGNKIGDEGVALLAAGLDDNFELQSLDLSKCSISATAIYELFWTGTQLRHLSLSNNDIGSEGAVVIARGLGGNGTLMSANLSSNNIGDEGAIAVARGLRGNLTLKSINLSNNNIGVAGVEALALLLQRNILNLDLSSKKLSDSHQSQNKFTADSSSSSLSANNEEVNTPQDSDGDPVTIHDEEVNQVPHYCNLKVLDLSLNCCWEDCLSVLSQFKSLSRLKLSPMDPFKVEAVVDYAASSNNCRQLKFLFLNSCRKLRQYPLSSYCRHIDLHSGSGFIVDLSGNDFIDKTTAITLLQILKKYHRVNEVRLNFTDNIEEEEFAELKETYQNDVNTCWFM